MKDEAKNREQLLEELRGLRSRLEEIESGRLEEALKESAERYQSLFEISSDAIFIADTNSLRILDFNDAALDMFGYERDEMGELGLFELVPGDARRRIEEEEEQQGGRKNYVFIEALGLRKDCSVFPIEIRSKRLRLEGKDYKVCFTRDISDRKKAESSLLQSEAYFRSLVENDLDMIVVVGPDSCIRSISPSVERIFDLESEAIMRKTPMELMDLVHPEDRDMVLSLVEEARRKAGVSGPIEFRGGSDGDYSSVGELFANNLLGDPFVQGIVYTCHDISERKQAEESLQQHRNYLQALLENSPGAVVVVDRDSRIRSASLSLLRLFKAQPEDILGKARLDFLNQIREEDRGKIMNFIETVRAESKVAGPIEFRATATDGSDIILELRADNLLDDPFINGIVYRLNDITLRKQAEDALRKSEETLRALVNGITDGAALLDVEGMIISINETGAKRLQTPLEKLPGANIFDLFPAELSEARKERVKEVFTTGKPVSFSDSRDGLFLEHSIIPVLDSNNEVRQVVAFVRDVTDHVLLEEALIARSQELESFCQTISHDLCNPLTIVESYAMTAKTAIEEGHIKIAEESLKSIIKAARRLENLTENLLSYARAGSQEGFAQRVDPRQIIEGLLEELGPKIERMGAKVEIVEELPILYVDPVRFEQVIYNLLDNALKFSSSNPEPLIKIGATIGETEATFRLADNGIGIDSQFWEIVFEPFKRFSASESPGLGIGLATVKRAVTGWGGEIWIESVPGKGSTCYFTAPMANA